MSNLSLHCRHQLNLFRRQYLQLQIDITYPDAECLRKDTLQQALLQEVFSDNAIIYQPPQRYQLRILKELIRRIEASITNWEEEVCNFLISLYLFHTFVFHSAAVPYVLFVNHSPTHCLRVSGYLRWSPVSISRSLSDSFTTRSNSSSR
jgi:hypothetical protein